MTSYGHFDRWTIEVARPETATRLQLGPFDQDWLPDRFFAVAVDEQGGWRVDMNGTFDGSRISVPALSLSRPGGVRPGDLTALQLPEIVRLAAESLGTVDVASHVGRRPNRKPQGEELQLVAAVYAWTFATWGNPRAAVADVWDLKPATASYWISKAREIYAFPNPQED